MQGDLNPDILSEDAVRDHESVHKFGATHAAESIEAAQPIISELTGSVMADVLIITVGVLTGELIGQTDTLLAKGGRLVTTSVARFAADTISLPISAFSLSGKSATSSAGPTAPTSPTFWTSRPRVSWTSIP